MTTRRELKLIRPVLPRKWQPRTEQLPDSEHQRGRNRCAAIGLIRGDCREPKEHNSIYCYYHDKLQRELTEPTAQVYPVWPLPNVPWDFVREAA